MFNMLSRMQDLGIFFKYSKKKIQRKLEVVIDEMANKNKLKIKIKRLCKIWCMEQHDAFEDLFQLYKSVLNSLKSVENNIDAGNQFSGKSLTEASGLFKEM